MEREWHVSIAIVLLAFAGGAYFYPQLPQNIAVHWGLQGNANGFAGKEMGAFGVPALMALLLAVFFILPKIDPLDRDYRDFRKQYCGFVLAFTLFLAYVDGLGLAYNLGRAINVGQLLIPGFGALIFYVGTILPKVKRNWFVGIRTPWTLSDPAIWEKTHALGSQLFKAAGIVMLMGTLFPSAGLPASIAVLLGVVVASAAYSFTRFNPT